MKAKNRKRYIDCDYLSSSKRFLSSFLDAIFLTIVCFLTLLLVNSVILPNISFYKNASNEVNNATNNMALVNNESKIVKYHDAELKSPYSIDEMFKEYVLKEVLYSYSVDNTIMPFTPTDSLSVGLASYSNDQFSQFYLDYVPLHNENENIIKLKGKTYHEYFISSMKNFDLDNSIFKDYNVTPNEYPQLTATAAKHSYNVLFNGSIDKDEQATTNKFLGFFNNMWNQSSTELSNSTLYQNLYNSYKSNYLLLSKGLLVSSLICYLISFILIIAVPQLIFIERRCSFGLLILKGASVHKDRKPVNGLNIFLRNLILFFSNLVTLLAASFFAGGLNAGLAMPLWDGGVSLLQILIIFSTIPVINMIITMYTKSHSAPAELISSTLILDTNKIASDVIVKEKEKEEKIGNDGEINLVVNDVPYIDSSTIPEDKE